MANKRSIKISVLLSLIIWPQKAMKKKKSGISKAFYIPALGWEVFCVALFNPQGSSNFITKQ